MMLDQIYGLYILRDAIAQRTSLKDPYRDHNCFYMAEADATMIRRPPTTNAATNSIRELRQSDQTRTIGLNKSTSNLFRARTDNPKRRIDVRDFNHVLKVDAEPLVADVEGMTTYEDLVDATLKYHLLPTVVPQLKTITLGGAVSGLGIESSSFKYGLVHETVRGDGGGAGGRLNCRGLPQAECGPVLRLPKLLWDIWLRFKCKSKTCTSKEVRQADSSPV